MTVEKHLSTSASHVPVAPLPSLPAPVSEPVQPTALDEQAQVSLLNPVMRQEQIIHSVDQTQTSQLFQFEVVTVDAAGQVIDRRQRAVEHCQENLGDGLFLDLVKIPGGRFRMGAIQGEEGASKDEFPQHDVTVPGFWMGKFAVTQAQWKAVANLPKVNIDLELEPAHFKGDHRPVEQVSWYEAIEFCERLSRKTQKAYRLPSEAEWEYACRATTTTPFHCGATVTPDLANYDGNYTYAQAPKGKYREQTIDVGNFPPNAFGLYDMHGNIWEWCLDTWHDSYDQAPVDGSAWIDESNEYRILRGGSWVNFPLNCRSALRYIFLPACRYKLIGFRVLCVPA